MSEPTPPRRRRRWFSLSLRGLMLLILILGGAMGWKARRAGLQRRAVARVEQLRGGVIYDWQYGGHARLIKPSASPPGPVWLRRILGDEYFQEVVQVNLPANLEFGPPMGQGSDALEKWSEANKTFKEKIVEPLEDDQLACLEPFDRLGSVIIQQSFPLRAEGLARLDRLTHLKELHIGNNFERDDLSRLGSLTNLEILSFQTEFDRKTDVRFLDKLPKIRNLNIGGLYTTDDHLATVSRLPNLESLSVTGIDLTDAGLAHLKDLKSLKYLSITFGNKMTGEGLVHLEGLTNLENLLLSGLPMNNVGLGHLRKLPKLNTLTCTRGQLDDATLEEFKLARPGVSIFFLPNFSFTR